MVFSQSMGEWQKKGEAGREISKIAKTHYLAYVSHRLLFPDAVVKPWINRPQSAAVGREEHFPQPGDGKSFPRYPQVWNGALLKYLSGAAVWASRRHPPREKWGTLLRHLRGTGSRPGDSSQNWLRRFESVKTTTEKEESSDSISVVGGKGPIQPQHTPLPKLLSTPTGAMLDSKEKSDSEYSPLSENIFPISSFTAHLLCLWGGFFPSSLSCNFGSFFYFSWMVQSAEVAFFSCLQNSLKYCRVGANRSRGVTTTSRMREIHIFSISLKKQQISVLWLSIKGARAPGSHRELHKLNTELSARKTNQPQCPQ